MSDEPCLPTTIPTTTTLTASGFWGRMVRTDQPESPQLLVILVAAAVLIVSTVGVVVPCAKWIWGHGDLGYGACTALGLSISALALLAGHSNYFIGGIIGGHAHSGTSDERGKP